MGVQVVDGGILGQQGHSGLFSNALYSGDIVGAVSHEGLQIHDMDGVKAVYPSECLRCHLLGGGLSHAGGHQANGGMLGDELQGILVSGNDLRVPSGGGVLGGDGAQQVVRFPAVQLVHGDVHGGQHILQNGHLAGQLLGHPLSLGLIALIGQVTEGGGLSVECDAQGVGLAVLQLLIQDVQKAQHRIGGLARPGGQVLTDPVKGTVHNGISIQCHQFHGKVPHSPALPAVSIIL